jgi:putative RNA 2'-phosphotransferase
MIARAQYHWVRREEMLSKTDTKAVGQASKKLSWLLRHGAAEAGVAMDADGWAKIEDVLRVVRVSRALFEQAVAQNDKKRFEVDGEFVRACQGHSSGVVSMEAMEASWTELEATDGLVWHGTSVDAIDGIATSGIVSVSRTHVHLAESPRSTVGKRANVDVLLGVSLSAMRALGERLWKSPNGVILARHVPVTAITTAQGATRRGEAALGAVRVKLGLENG